MAILVKTDRNGTKYWYEQRCPKCGGSGYLPEYHMVSNGICFKCEGSGEFPHTWKEYTEEYAAKLEERRIAREKKKAPEKNAKFFREEGFNEEGFMWIVLGDTFKIKEELKAAGARFSYKFLWHFDHEDNGYPCVKISIEDVAEKNIVDLWILDDYVWEYIEDLRKKNAPKTESEYIGEIGEKFDGDVVLSKIHTYTTHFTYYGETHYIYKFTDADGNTIVWKTSWHDVEEDKKYHLSGKIKEHEEYNGDKQTVLTRCKITEI